MERAAHQQGRLLGRMEGLGFEGRIEAQLETLTDDVVHSSEIEGEDLPQNQVRSSIARQLGMNHISNLVSSSRDVDSVVAMMIDAMTNFDKALSEERLFKWHSSLFEGENRNHRITIGHYRDRPMEVVSGPYGKERVHFEAPLGYKLRDETNKFLNWLETPDDHATPLLRAGIAHLWFVSIHPFDDGNGRIARAIADMAFARAENSNQRY